MSKLKAQAQEGILCSHENWKLAGIFIALFRLVFSSKFLNPLIFYFFCKGDKEEREKWGHRQSQKLG